MDDRATDRKQTPVFQGVLSYFPDAIRAIAKVSAQGNIQHGLEGEKLKWQKDISNDHEDAMVRHLLDHSESPMDADGHLHLTKVAWRALAALQVYIETDRSKYWIENDNVDHYSPSSVTHKKINLSLIDEDEMNDRMNIIGRNGNTGDHYDALRSATEDHAAVKGNE